ncbi:MAG: hypothetical protein IKB71_02040 [Lentisphaeria bacterium]|nr:hypothetical protein [Lentisphaeria bacterium]
MEYRKNEKGAALLLALGFAALLLVLVMGFVTNALIERKVASTNADRTEAKSIAMSALNRSIAAMQYQIQALSNANFFDSGIYRFDNIVSKYDNNTSVLSSFPANANDPEFSGMEDIFVHRNDDFILNGSSAVNFNNNNRTYGLKNGADLYVYKYPLAHQVSSRYYDFNENKSNAVTQQEIILRQPQWQYVRQGNNSNDPIIGRYLYAVLPDMGKFSRRAFIGTASASGSSISSNLSDKIGRFDSEFASDYFMPLIRYSYDTLRYENGEQFFKSSQAFDLILRASEQHSSLSANQIADSTFEVFNMVEPLTSNSNLNTNFRQGNPYTTRLMHNLLTSTGTINLPTSVSGLQSEVPYLNKIDSDATVRNQIAANIIEFFRTSDNVVGYDADNPMNTTYTGNRLTPYINEFTLSLSNLTADVSVDIDPVTNQILSTEIRNPNVTINSSFELYDIFGRAPANTDTVTFSGTVTVEFSITNNSGGTISNGSVTAEIPFTMTSSGIWSSFSPSSGTLPTHDTIYYGQSGTYTHNSMSYSNSNPMECTGTCALRARITGISNAYITFSQGGNVVDFVKDIRLSSNAAEQATISSQPLNSNNSAGTALTGTTNNVISYQINDPFNNLDGQSTNWAISDTTTTTNIGQRNSNYFYSSATGGQLLLIENVARLRQIAADFNSTPAIYSNITLADLGLISRGRPGETLQIHSVGATDTNSINGTVNDISVTAAPASNPTPLADGGLLDQITTMVDANPQLIDINTRSVAVWRSLLSNIRGDVTAANPTPQYILDATQAENLARKISYNIRQNREFFKSRSGFIAVFNASLVAVNSIPATTSNITGNALSDREKQIIIGKILPLCKTEDYPEFIQVIVVAQKIKDRDGAGTLGTYEHGADQIVSEVRLLAKLRRGNDNRIKIISIEELID